VWTELEALGVHYHGLADGVEAIALALRLERRSAFDAAYVQLATQIGAELWTLDGALARNAGGRGYPVNLIVTGDG
jgi:predicted nucleic acid-binding protein